MKFMKNNPFENGAQKTHRGASMKRRMVSMFIVIIFLVGIAGLAPGKLEAVSDNTIRAYNIAGQGLGTLIRGLIQGKVKSFKSAAKMLLWGSAAGYGFYESKRMIGNGSVTGGVILANISASISENTSRGDNPLAYLGYTIGPARINIATPFAGKERTLFNIQISPMDIIGFANAMKNADKVSFRNGMISFESTTPITENSRGWTMGIYPTVVSGAPGHVFNHETIHVVQYIQTMAVSPQPLTCLLNKGATHKKLINISLLNFNYVSILNGFTLNEKSPNIEIWNEIEAYALAK
jgi:hypothetical protein